MLQFYCKSNSYPIDINSFPCSTILKTLWGTERSRGYEPYVFGRFHTSHCKEDSAKIRLHTSKWMQKATPAGVRISKPQDAKLSDMNCQIDVIASS